MAHLMPCIPKSEFQVASGVSSCASAGAATTVSSGLSETSDGLSWSKMINKSWTGTASSIHLESIKCFVRFIGWWCYKIRTPENQKHEPSMKSKNSVHIPGTSHHQQSHVRTPRYNRSFLRFTGWCCCCSPRWRYGNLRWLGSISVVFLILRDFYRVTDQEWSGLVLTYSKYVLDISFLFERPF